MSLEERCVYVKGIPDGSTTTKLSEYFTRVGELSQCVLKIGPSSEISGDGFVVFVHAQDAIRAVRDITGRKFNGSIMEVVMINKEQLPELHMLLPELVQLDIKPETSVGDETTVDELVQLLSKMNPDVCKQAFRRLGSQQGDTPSSPTKDLKPGIQKPLAPVEKTYITPIPACTRPPDVMPADNLNTSMSTFGHFAPRIATFSGEEGSKGDASFNRWKYEVKSLMQEGCSTSLVLQSIRRSLKGTAADVLTWMPPDASPQAILQKLEGLYGDVLSGERLMQKFYSESQKQDEAVSSWGFRLEHMLTGAIEKGIIPLSAKNDMLKAQFWANLHDERVKNASRYKYDQIADFGEFCVAVRVIEQELLLDAKRRKSVAPKAQSHMMSNQTEAPTSTETQIILKKLEALTKKVNQLEQSRRASPRKANSMRQNPNRMVICYRCGSEGHYANRCSSSTRISDEEVLRIKERQQTLNSNQSLPQGTQRT